MSRHLRVQCPHNYTVQSPLASYLQHLRISPDGNPAFTDVNSNSDSADGAASWMLHPFVCNHVIFLYVMSAIGL